MKYIKKYNESVDDHNLKDYFLDFIDDKFKISIVEINTMPKITLHCIGHYDTISLLNKIKKSTNELEDKFSIYKLSINHKYNNTFIEFSLKEKEHKNESVIEIKYKDDGDICEYNLEIINVYITNIYDENGKNTISSDGDRNIGKIFLYGKDLYSDEIVRLEWIFKDGYTYDHYMNQDNHFYKDEHHTLNNFTIDKKNADKVYNALKKLDFDHQPAGSIKAFQKLKKEDLIKK